MAKKKWYDTWWGLLWTLALVDAHPGQGLQAFMELDNEMKHLPEFEENAVSKRLISKKKRPVVFPCPADASSEP